MSFCLRFIAGDYSGGEVPIKPNRELIAGRSSEFDMVLDDDMVSRRHARFFERNGAVHVADCQSTNGTLVNDQPITEYRLSPGDTVTIGRSVLELIERPAEGVAPNWPSTTGAGDRSTQHRAGLEGRFPDLGKSVTELLQMVSRSRKPAVLDLKSSDGERIKIYCRDGQVVSAKGMNSDSNHPEIGARKALLRGMGFESGQYKIRGFAPDRVFEDVLDEDLKSLLRLISQEAEIKEQYADLIPARTAKLVLVHPLEPRLSELTTEVLDTLQLALNFPLVADVLNRSSASDIETAQDLVYLIQSGYLSAR